MPRRFRPLVPHPRLFLLCRVAAAGFALAALASLILSTEALSFRTFAYFALCLLFLRFSVCGLSGNDEAVNILKGWHGRVVRFDIIDSFEWLHNIEGPAGVSKRLWFVLDDGQKVPTPVVVGHGPLSSFDSMNVWLTPDQAEALVAELDTRRRAQQVEAEQPPPA